jgi:hypothetical protein
MVKATTDLGTWPPSVLLTRQTFEPRDDPGSTARAEATAEAQRSRRAAEEDLG